MLGIVSAKNKQNLHFQIFSVTRATLHTDQLSRYITLNWCFARISLSKLITSRLKNRERCCGCHPSLLFMTTMWHCKTPFVCDTYKKVKPLWLLCNFRQKSTFNYLLLLFLLMMKIVIEVKVKFVNPLGISKHYFQNVFSLVTLHCFRYKISDANVKFALFQSFAILSDLV